MAQAAFADILLLEPLTAGTPQRILALFAATLLPYSAISPFLGVFVDRWDRRGLMVWTDVTRAALLLSLPMWSRSFGGDSDLFVCALAILGLGRLFLTTKGAALPFLLHERDLIKGNALSGAGGNVSATAGGAIGLGLAGWIGATWTISLAGLVYVGGAILARSISATMAHPHAPRTGIVTEFKVVARELRAGLIEVWRSLPARLSLTSIFVLRTMGMILAVAAILLIRNEFPGSEGHFGRLGVSGLALGSVGVGALIGAGAVARVGGRYDEGRIILAGFVLSGTGLLVLGGIAGIPALLALTTVAGFGGMVTKIAVDAEVQGALADEYRGRAFALYDILYNFASVVAGIVIVTFAASSLRSVLPVAGAVTLALAFSLGLAMHRSGMIRPRFA